MFQLLIHELQLFVQYNLYKKYCQTYLDKPAILRGTQMPCHDPSAIAGTGRDVMEEESAGVRARLADSCWGVLDRRQNYDVLSMEVPLGPDIQRRRRNLFVFRASRTRYRD
jgi:hypothetical protein